MADMDVRRALAVLVMGRGLLREVALCAILPQNGRNTIGEDAVDLHLAGRKVLVTGASKGIGRAATPEEIAAMAVFLASDLSGYASGTIVTIDGGAAHRGAVM